MYYDVVIIGGGTAGCSAAYTSAKLGLKTLLIEQGIHLGGTISSGLVIPVMKSGENQINTEFYQKLISELKNIGGEVNFQNNPGWFNPELIKIILDKMLREVCVDLRFETSVFSVQTDYGRIKSILIPNKLLSPYNYTIHDDKISTSHDDILSECIEANYFIDATGNCDFSKKINCEFLNDSSEFQPMSLRFIMGGINLKTLSEWLLRLDTDRTITVVEELDGEIHLSTACTWDSSTQWVLAPIFDEAVKNNDLKDSDRNYFQVFSIAGMPDSLAFNCPRIVENLNPNDISDRTKALILARESILRLSNFVKKYFPGCHNAYISNIADMLGVRVSNRIKGKYIYTIDDLKSGKKFDNPVVISDYPVDIHSRDKNSSTLEQTGEYQLPIESLMSANYDNLFVAGRCLSADYLAQGALRVQASCFSMGEGVAKYIKNIISKVD